MKFEIVEIEELSGSHGRIYSIILGDDDCTVFDKFITANIRNHPKEVKEIYGTLKAMGQKTGIRDHFFKENEGHLGDGVCALYDSEESNLRLYCVKYGKIAVLLGGGGVKSKKIKAWQEDVTLSENAELMISISETLTQAIKDKELILTSNGDFKGELIYENDENSPESI